MKTTHQIVYDNANKMREVYEDSVHLIVTSPPYPMIKMWDEQFASLNPDIRTALKNKNGGKAFDLMHKELKKVWKECYRVLQDGGIACINIGDATRKVDSVFRLFPNHARIVRDFEDLGFSQLPSIIWRKQTNKPNKFMGSGMLPVNAYVTLEHEFILVFRKGKNRTFEDKENRRKSSFFWEERNQWFSDVWLDLKGTNQLLNYQKLRERSAAYPFELPYRIISMYSVIGDTVIDPFLGTGTTTAAALHLCRNSIGYEIEEDFQKVIEERIKKTIKLSKKLTEKRIKKHLRFVKKRNNKLKYKSKNYGFPVMTKSEIKTRFYPPVQYEKKKDGLYEVTYKELKEPITS